MSSLLFWNSLLGICAVSLLARPADPLLAKLRDNGFELVSGSVNGSAIALGTPPAVITVHGGAVLSGQAGSARFFGGIDVTEAGAVRWEESRFAVTGNGLDEPDRAVLGALRAVKTLSFDGEDLIMESSDPAVNLRFVRLTPERGLARMLGAELFLGALTVAGKEIPLPATPVTIRLLSGGRLAGRSSVNSFSGSYAVEEAGALGPITLGASTQMAGPPEAMEFEGIYFQALSEVIRGKVTPGGITFESASRTTWLRFALQAR